MNRSILFVFWGCLALVSCTTDYVEMTNNRVTDYSGLYTDTLTIRRPGWVLQDTVIQKRLVRINDSTYKMPFGLGVIPGDPNSTRDSIILYIKNDNSVITELSPWAMIGAPQLPSYTIPQQGYFYITYRFDNASLRYSIERMRRL
jgi:hypothetical protein